MANELASGGAVVIGGSGGLGVEICRLLAEAGSGVAIGYRSQLDAAARLANELAPLGVKVIAGRADLAEPESVGELLKTAEAAFGFIHSVIFAAGAQVQLAPVADMPREAWRHSIATEVNGFFDLLQASLPYLRRSRGSIVALSTAATHRYAPLDILSAGPKAGVEQLVKAVAREEGRSGVRANGVRVGYIEAGQGLALQGDAQGQRLAERVLKATPLGRLGTARDVAYAVLFLASPRARYITGEFLCVDGGGHL